MGTFNTIASAINQKVKKFIFFSSVAIYSDIKTPYGITKKFGEEICNEYRNDIDVLILRPFNIYGPGQNAIYNYAIQSFSKAINSNKSVKIYGDDNQSRDFFIYR